MKVVKQMKSEFVFVFLFFFTFGHSVSVRDDGLGQNDQFIFLQFVYFCVIMKQTHSLFKFSQWHTGVP